MGVVGVFLLWCFAEPALRSDGSGEGCFFGWQRRGGSLGFRGDWVVRLFCAMGNFTLLSQ